jgi:coproporphyrinogen III oxidase-like Fe-S oxidoreductase
MNKVFGAFYTTARSLFQFLHHNSSTYSLRVHAPSLSTMCHYLDCAASSQLHRCQRRGSIMRSLLSNHVFNTEYDNLRRHDSVVSVAMFNLYYLDISI